MSDEETSVIIDRLNAKVKTQEEAIAQLRQNLATAEQERDEFKGNLRQAQELISRHKISSLRPTHVTTEDVSLFEKPVEGGRLVRALPKGTPFVSSGDVERSTAAGSAGTTFEFIDAELEDGITGWVLRNYAGRAE